MSPRRVTTEADEFRFLRDCAEEAGLEWSGQPTVERRHVDVDGRALSSLVWGATPPQLVLIHGGAQNAHTWDTVVLALAEPLVSVDLPGHGHSSWREDGDYDAATMARDVSVAVSRVAPAADTAVGVGLGASVALLVSDMLAPQIKRLVMVDSVAGAAQEPRVGGGTEVAAAVSAFTSRHHYPSFEAMLERTGAYSPGRSESALRRGIEHNAVARPDGSWQWRWDPGQREPRDYAKKELAGALDRFAGHVLVVRGGASDVVTDEAVADIESRCSSVRLVTIPRAEHGVQGTHPVPLATTIRDFLATA
jgi:pimeloyl-ACP methyl ester carboxylesterase